MADAQTADEPAKQSLGRKAWEFAKSTAKEAVTDIGQEIGRGVEDVGSTFQACIYTGWHTQSASIDSPEHISEQLAKDKENEKLEPKQESPKVGLEKE